MQSVGGTPAGRCRWGPARLHEPLSGPEAPAKQRLGRSDHQIDECGERHLHQPVLDVPVKDALSRPPALPIMVVFSLLIINKAGGLVYNRSFAPGLQKLDSNDYLILAGTFHGIHAIARSINPAPPAPHLPGNRRPPTTGIESLESSHFRLTCFQTPTGVKFLLFTSPEQPNADVIVRRCYEIFGDFVMKNPFYSMEMPIRVEKFERALAGYLVRPG